MDEQLDEDLSDSEIEEFFIENERLLTEENLAVRNVEAALRYACCYVPFKLIKRYRKLAYFQ